MKKRFLSIVLIGVLSVSLCACGKSESASNNDVTKTTEPTTSVELSQETKITKKMSDSEKITTAFDNTINADSFLMLNIMNSYGDVSNFDPRSKVYRVYEFYKDKSSYIGIETDNYYLYLLSQIDLNNKEEIIDFHKSYGVNEEIMNDVIRYCETGEKVNEYSVGHDIESLRNHNYYFCEGIKDNLYYNYNVDAFGVERSKIDVSGYQDEFFYYYNREFSKALDKIYEYDYGLPYRHFIRAVGMVFDNYPKSKDDLFFVTDFNNEDGVYSFEVYLLDFYRYYAANSDYQLPQEANSGSNDIKIGVRYVLDGNYLTEITAYLLRENDTKYEDYSSYIFENINSISETDSVACAYFKIIDEKYEPGNYKKAAEIFFSEFDDEDDERFKLGSSDENGVPIIIQYSGSSTSKYAYNGYIYEYVEDSGKDVGRNQLGYYTAKEVLDSIVNGTPLAEVPEWLIAYDERFKNEKTDYHKSASLIYLNDDDIPECVLWFYEDDSFYHSYAYLLGYNNGLIENELYIAQYGLNGFHYAPKSGLFYTSNWVNGYGEENYIKKLTDRIEDIGNAYNYDVAMQPTYTVNGENVSSSEEVQDYIHSLGLNTTVADSELYDTVIDAYNALDKKGSGNGSTSTKQASSQNSSQDSDYILPDCNSRYYSIDELSVLSDEQLKLARNEIYTRHGYIFQPGNTKNYFDSKSWYRGTVSEVTDDMLNEFEIANRDMIIAIENDTLGDVSWHTGNSPKFVNNDEFFSSVPADVVKNFNASVPDDILEAYPTLKFVSYDEDTTHIYGVSDDYYFDFMPDNNGGYGVGSTAKEYADWWPFEEQ